MSSPEVLQLRITSSQSERVTFLNTVPGRFKP